MGDGPAADDGWSTPSYGGSPNRPAGRGSAPSTNRSPRTTNQEPESGWSTPTRTAGAGGAAPSSGTPRNRTGSRNPRDDEWLPAGPMSARQQRATRAADRRAQPASAGRQRATATANRPAATTAPAMPPERGLHPAIAVGVLVAITLVGALIDSIGSLSGQDAFNIAVIIGSAVAVLLVRRSQLFWVVVAPPLVYAVIAVVRLYIKRSTSGRRGAIGAIISTVQDYLVFGFPALAGAVALVLVIAGVRVARRR